MREEVRIRDLSNGQVEELAWAIDHYGYTDITTEEWQKAAVIMGKSVCLNYELKPNNNDLEPSDYITSLVNMRYDLRWKGTVGKGNTSLYIVGEGSCSNTLSRQEYLIREEEVEKGEDSFWGNKITIVNVSTMEKATFFLALVDDLCATHEESLMSMIAEMELGDAFCIENYSAVRKGYLGLDDEQLKNHREIY